MPAISQANRIKSSRVESICAAHHEHPNAKPQQHARPLRLDSLDRNGERGREAACTHRPLCLLCPSAFQHPHPPQHTQRARCPTIDQRCCRIDRLSDSARGRLMAKSIGWLIRSGGAPRLPCLQPFALLAHRTLLSTAQPLSTPHHANPTTDQHPTTTPARVDSVRATSSRVPAMSVATLNALLEKATDPDKVRKG